MSQHDLLDPLDALKCVIHFPPVPTRFDDSSRRFAIPIQAASESFRAVAFDSHPFDNLSSLVLDAGHAILLMKKEKMEEEGEGRNVDSNLVHGSSSCFDSPYSRPSQDSCLHAN